MTSHVILTFIKVCSRLNHPYPEPTPPLRVQCVLASRTSGPAHPPFRPFEVEPGQTRMTEPTHAQLFLILRHHVPLGNLATRVVADLPPVLAGGPRGRRAQQQAPDGGVRAARVAIV